MRHFSDLVLNKYFKLDGNSLAWVIIGGLISSMFLTLIVVPFINYIFDRIMQKSWQGRKERNPD
ncbi:hypothetical protein [Aquiflexum lacus]|uniref:hypothetical protein n=1 Tax=Aquiflexum lacus TaxID=2483805 RepID=UPI001E352151|nr:hypothetical protein [Aquiflexum lacus]